MVEVTYCTSCKQSFHSKDHYMYTRAYQNTQAQISGLLQLRDNQTSGSGLVFVHSWLGRICFCLSQECMAQTNHKDYFSQRCHFTYWQYS